MKNRKRNRLQGYDYAKNNLYFVTICVQDRNCCFGNVGTGRDLSLHDDCGETLRGNKNHNPSIQLPHENKMILNEYGTIAHGRLEWLEKQYEYVLLHSFIVMPNHVHAIIEIDSNLIGNKEFKIKSISELVGAYKTTSSKLIHLSGFDNFSWQRSFHDHIIRNEKSYATISNYIDTNADRWNTDTFFENI